MKKTKVAINGLGRIGRALFRSLSNEMHEGLELVAVNNPGNPNEYVHLLNYDSLHGKSNNRVTLSEDSNYLVVNGNKIRFFSEKDPSKLPWGEFETEVVIDATGRFKDKESLGQHKRDTVKKVIMCAPGKDLDGTFVMGINHETYDAQKHDIISNASCTTNCLAPVAKVLNDTFKIENGFMTTIHAYTLDQQLLDGSHSDPRRSRAAALSMIPTTTGAAKAVGLVIPELNGKLDGYAIRVPTPDVSVVDLTVNLSKEVTAQSINAAIKEASETNLKGILGYSDEPLVSIDFMGRTESSIFDPALTNVNGKVAKVVSWYDNEIGFASRVLDLATYVGERL